MKQKQRLIWMIIMLGILFTLERCGYIRYYTREISHKNYCKKLKKHEEVERLRVSWYEEVKMFCKDLVEKEYPSRSPIDGVLYVSEPIEKDSVKIYMAYFKTYEMIVIGTMNIMCIVIVIEEGKKIRVYELREWMKVIKEFEHKYGKEDRFIDEIKIFLKTRFAGGW